MPAEDRHRPHRPEVLPSAIGPDTVQPDPEGSIARPQPRMRSGPQRDLKLVTERQVLQHQLAPPSRGQPGDHER
jgi:hypothetical protein